MSNQEFQGKLERQIDQLCDEFEQELRSGGYPKVDEYLNRISANGRAQLSKELLLVAIDYAGVNLRSPSHTSQQTRADAFRTPSQWSTTKSSIPDTSADASHDGALSRVGDYELLDEIGAGGMGVVYRARQSTVGRLVALKVFRPDHWRGLSTEQRNRAVVRFLVESQAAACREHPNILTVHDAGQRDGVYFLAMQYVDGGSLADRVVNGPMDDRQAAMYVEPVCRALHAVHGAGIIHRDLKPSNILIENGSDRSLVCDFGLAKVFERTEELTLSGDFFGTPAYMSPEQILTTGQVTPATDVYGIGATLYHLLTGRPPFQATTVPGIIHQVLTGEPVAPRLLNPAISRDMETITLKCLEKEPRRRYPDALEVARDLQRFLAGSPISARPLRPYELFSRWCGRHRALAALGALFSMMLVGVVIVVSVLYARERGARVEAATASAELSRQLRQTCITNARLENPSGESLLWLLRALALDADSPTQESVDRLRIAQVWAQCHKPIQMWFHSDPIEACCIGRNGRLAAAAFGSTAVLYNLATGDQLGGAIHLPARITCAELNADGRLLAISGLDGTTIVWDVYGQRKVATTMVHEAAVRRLAFDQEGSRLATASMDRTARVWDAETGLQIGSSMMHPKQVMSVSFSDNGQRLLTTCADGASRIWDVESSSLQTEMRHCASVHNAVLAPDGRFVLSSGLLDSPRLWDAATGEELLGAKFQHPPRVNCAVFSIDGTLVISGGDDGTVRFWSTSSGDAIGLPLEHGSPIAALHLDATGRSLVSVGKDGSVVQWSLDTMRPIGPATVPALEIGCACLSTDGQMFLTGSADGIVRLWERPQVGEVVLTSAEESPLLMECSADGRALLLADETGALRSISLEDRSVRETSIDSRITTAAIASKPWIGVVGCSNGELYRWDFSEQSALSEPINHGARVLAVVCNVDGSNFVSVGVDGAIRMWDWSGACQRTIPSAGPARSACTHAASGRLALVGEDAIRLWQLSAGDLRLTSQIELKVDNRFVDFAPDGEQLVACSISGAVSAWNADSGQQEQDGAIVLSGVTSAFLFSDATQIALIDPHGRVTIQNLTPGQATEDFAQHDPAIASITIGLKGTWLASVSTTGTVRFYDQATAALVGGPLYLADPQLRRTPAFPGSAISCDRHGEVRLISLRPDERSIRELSNDIPLITNCAPAQSGKFVRLDSEALARSWSAYSRRKASARDTPGQPIGADR